MTQTIPAIPDYPALVLNADFTPVSAFPLSTWDFARTMRNVLKERVLVLETYDRTLRSPSFSYRPPSVVALRDYVSIPEHVPFTRFNVFLRDDFTCQYCMKKCQPHELTFDHVIPRSQGGLTCFANIVAACVPCNTRKGARGDVRPQRTPRKPGRRELMKKQSVRGRDLRRMHHSWLDYLYWSGLLESDEVTPDDGRRPGAS